MAVTNGGPSSSSADDTRARFKTELVRRAEAHALGGSDHSDTPARRGALAALSWEGIEAALSSAHWRDRLGTSDRTDQCLGVALPYGSLRQSTASD